VSASQASDLHQVLVSLLADGKWHDYHSIVAKAAKTVQPGAAIRENERSRASRSRRVHGEVLPRVKPLTVAEQERAGARRLAAKRLNNAAFEIDPPRAPVGTPKRVRLKPKPTKQVKTSESVRVVPASRRSPAMQAVLELLSDGQWHDLPDVAEVAIPLVPEAIALRYVTRSRKAGGTERSKNIPRERSIQVGAYGTVYSMMRESVMLEWDRSGPVRRLRLKPR
jgi:hypothetical protein